MSSFYAIICNKVVESWKQTGGFVLRIPEMFSDTVSGRSHPCLSVVGRVMSVIIYRFNLNISPKRSYGVLECDIAVF